MDIQFFQNHLLKRLCFPQLIAFAPLANQLSLQAWVYLCPIDLLVCPWAMPHCFDFSREFKD